MSSSSSLSSHHVLFQDALNTWTLKSHRLIWIDGRYEETLSREWTVVPKSINITSLLLFPWQTDERTLELFCANALSMIENITPRLSCNVNPKWIKIVDVSGHSWKVHSLLLTLGLYFQDLGNWTDVWKASIGGFSRSEKYSASLWLFYWNSAAFSMTRQELVIAEAECPEWKLGIQSHLFNEYSRRQRDVTTIFHQWTRVQQHFERLNSDVTFPTSRHEDIFMTETHSETIQLTYGILHETLATMFDSFDPSVGELNSPYQVYYAAYAPLALKVNRAWCAKLALESSNTDMYDTLCQTFYELPHDTFIMFISDTKTDQSIEFHIDTEKRECTTQVPETWIQNDTSHVVTTLWPTFKEYPVTTTRMGILGSFRVDRPFIQWDLWTWLDCILQSPFYQWIRFFPIGKKTDRVAFVWTDLSHQLWNLSRVSLKKNVATADGTLLWDESHHRIVFEWSHPFPHHKLDIFFKLCTLMFHHYSSVRSLLVDSYTAIWNDGPLFPDTVFPQDLFQQDTSTTTTRERSIEQKKQMDLLLLYPQLFRKGHFKVQCQKNLQPTLVSAEEAQTLGHEHSLLFPPSQIDTIMPEYYACQKNGVYPFIGLKPNEGSPALFLPCCFKTSQLQKNQEKLARFTSSSSQRPPTSTTTMTMYGRKENRITKEHIIKYPGQFGDLPEDVLQYFIRVDPLADVARVGIVQSHMACIQCLEYWYVMEKQPLRTVRSDEELWTQLDHHLRSHWEMLRLSFPFRHKRDILHAWKMFEPPSKKFVNVLEWIPLLESFYHVQLLILSRSSTSRIEWSICNSVRCVPLSSNSPVVVLYEHYGGRTNVMMESKSPAVELILQQHILEQDKGYRFQFSSTFLHRWIQIHPRYFFRGRPLYSIPLTCWPPQLISKMYQQVQDELGHTRWIHFRLSTGRVITAYLSHPCEPFPSLPMTSTSITSSVFHFVPVDDFRIWYSECIDEYKTNLHDYGWSWTSLHTLPKIWIFTLSHTSLRFDMTFFIELETSPPLSIIQSTLRPPVTTSITDPKLIPSVEWQSIVISSSSPSPFRSIRFTQRMATLLLDFFTIAFQQYIQNTFPDMWKNTTCSSLSAVRLMVDVFLQHSIHTNYLSTDIPDTTSFQWFTYPIFATMNQRAVACGWKEKDTSLFFLPSFLFKQRLDFHLQWTCMYRWSFLKSLDRFSVLEHYYSSFLDFQQSSTFTLLPVPTTPHVFRHWIGASYPVVTRSLLSPFNSKDDELLVSDSTFFWIHPRESPWFPNIVLVQKCQPHTRKNIIEAYRHFYGDTHRVQECSSGEEETKGRDPREDIWDQFTIQELSLTSVPRIHSPPMTTIFTISPQFNFPDPPTPFIWILIPF